LGATIDASDLEEAGKQFDTNLKEIVAQNAKIANYVKKLESRDTEEPAPAAPGGPSDLPPAAELVAEIEPFLRQQRPEWPGSGSSAPRARPASLRKPRWRPTRPPSSGS